MLKRSKAVQEPLWWPLALRGVAAAIVGVLVLGLQGHRLTLLFGVYGGYMVVHGAIELVIAARSIGRHERWWQTMLSGLVGVYSIAFGGLMLWLAARLRQPRSPAPATLPASP